MGSGFYINIYIININIRFNRRGNNNICMGIPDVAKNDYSSFRIINGMDSDTVTGKTTGYDTRIYVSIVIYYIIYFYTTSIE